MEMSIKLNSRYIRLQSNSIHVFSLDAITIHSIVRHYKDKVNLNTL